MTPPDRSFVDKAKAAWCRAPEWTPCPDWVLELARLADTRRLKAAGEAIGYTASLVSMVLSNSYAGDMEKVRQKVMGVLMGETVDCPGLGQLMNRKTCLDWQDKPNAPTSSLRAKMYRACRSNCPHFRIRGGADGQ